jgi:hypothetical protein
MSGPEGTHGNQKYHNNTGKVLTLQCTLPLTWMA